MSNNRFESLLQEIGAIRNQLHRSVRIVGEPNPSEIALIKNKLRSLLTECHSECHSFLLTEHERQASRMALANQRQGASSCFEIAAPRKN